MGDFYIQKRYQPPLFFEYQISVRLFTYRSHSNLYSTEKQSHIKKRS